MILDKTAEFQQGFKRFQLFKFIDEKKSKRKLF